MEEFNKNEYFKNEIMFQSRHQFIYAQDNKKRNNFIEELDISFPIKVDNNDPMSVVLNISDFSNNGILNVKDDKLNSITREYTTFIIIYSLIKKSINCFGYEELNNRLEKLFKILNNGYVSDNKQIINISEFVSALEESIEFYKNFYISIVNGQPTLKTVDDLTLPFLQLEYFITLYKRLLNIGSHFSIIINNSASLDEYMVRGINSLIYARINKDISIKVFLAPGTWKSFASFNGQFIEPIHDYGTLELDDSYRQYTRKLVKNSDEI